MGLTFWSDRTFHSDEMNDTQYHCALPLTSISKITSSMINKAFSSIGKMYGGGDGEEDVLLGKLFKDPSPTNPKEPAWNDCENSRNCIFTD